MKVADTTPIRLFVLGDARIETSRGTIEPTAEVLFAAALYLILERKQPVSRRALEAVLWPDVSAATRSHRLRQTLLKLKRAGVPVESIGKAKLSLHGTAVSADFEELLATPPAADSSGTPCIGVLPDYYPRVSSAYDQWLDGSRDGIEAAITRLMLGLIAQQRMLARWTQVESNATQLLRVAPFNEQATLALAEAQAMCGAQLDAIRLLDSYLAENESGPADLRLAATIMRKRIAERMPPRAHQLPIETPFIGRGDLMKQLGSLLNDVVDNRGRVCMLWGEAGIGKTRLLDEFATFAHLQGIPTQRVGCRASDPHRPLSIFLDLVPALRSMRGAIGCSPDTISYLDRLTKHKPNAMDSLSDDPHGELVYAKVKQAMLDLVDAVLYENPLVVIIEDVQWLDSASASVLEDMIQWSVDRPVFFGLSRRDTQQLPFADESSRAQSIHVGPLDNSESTDVVLSVIRQHGERIGEDYLAWCLRIAEGNPYFLHELANHWIETGDDLTPPPSLTAVLNQRLKRIADDALQLLQASAVLEVYATLERIERLLGFEPHRLLRGLNELGRAGMITMQRSEGDTTPTDRVATKHELLSNAALALLTPPALAFVHRRAGLVLERDIDQEHTTAIVWDCAKHWQLAGDSARAYELATSCANQLMQVGLPSAAAEAFERSLPFCSTREQRLRVLENQAKAYYRSSAWNDVTRTIGTVRALREHLSPGAPRHDEFELMEFRAEWQSLKFEIIRRRATICLNATEATAAHRVEAGVMALMLLDGECDHAGMRCAYEIVESLAGESGVARADLIQARMVFHTACGDLSIGVSAARELVEHEKTKHNIGELFRAFCNASATLRGAGLFDEAEALLIASLHLAERHGIQRSTQRALPMLANMALERARYDEARNWLDMLLKTAPSGQDPSLRQDIAVIRVRLALADGDYESATRYLPSSMDVIAADPVYYRRTYHTALHVATALGAKREVKPRDVETLVDAHLRARNTMRQGFSAYVLYVALCVTGQEARGQALLGEYVHVHRREPWPTEPRLVSDILRLANLQYIDRYGRMGEPNPENYGAIDPPRLLLARRTSR
ncbi:MAG: AAA family ATPase [Gemmatimonadaceae bacterium]|nr:AAA family ATPase [Gemmatimonadaceae bacterium]